jgi:hypothetical protein
MMGGARLMIGLYVTLEALKSRSFIMGTKYIDRTGVRYGKLVAVKDAGRNKHKKVMWECLCDCGNVTVVPSGALVTGNTTSCGCDAGNYKHGGTGKGSYNTWRAMVRRCTKPEDKDYPRYGGVGVSVCERWLVYENFAADMGEPNGDETLDRIDVYGNYEPNNCRWAGVKTQNRNVRVRSNSKTKVTGVSKTNSGTYMAKVTVGKKAFYSKCFKTIEEAAAARKELERLHWGIA